MKFYQKLEKKLGRFAIPNLYVGIIVVILVGYFFRFTMPQLYDKLTLMPYYITVKHEYWRLFTWIFQNPFVFDKGAEVNIIFVPISLLFYYWICKRLEAYWGKFTFNAYIFGGIILVDIAVVLAGFYTFNWSADASTNSMLYQMVYASNGAADIVVSNFVAPNVTYYMLISIFLAFTVIGGDNMVYLYFILPIKMRWLGYLDLIWLAYYWYAGDTSLTATIPISAFLIFTRVIIPAIVLNFFIYYILNRQKNGRTISQIKRANEFHRAMKRAESQRKPDGVYDMQGRMIKPKGAKIIEPGYGNPQGISIHKCAICGRTENDDPNLEFRFCSKCNGNYEYCMDHLYTHSHVQ